MPTGAADWNNPMINKAVKTPDAIATRIHKDRGNGGEVRPNKTNGIGTDQFCTAKIDSPVNITSKVTRLVLGIATGGSACAKDR
jgi:hypothetical protein